MLERVYAQGVSTGVTTTNVSWATNLASVFGLLINIVIGAAVALSIVFLGMGGIKYITSQGDAKAADAARAAITNAVIGLIIAIAAFGIRTLVGNVIGGQVSITNVTPF